MYKQQYQVVVKTQENEIVNTFPLEEKLLTDIWSNMIEKTQARFDFIFTLQRRFVDNEPTIDWLEIWKQQKERFLLLTDKIVISKWDTIAEVNTKFQ